MKQFLSVAIELSGSEQTQRPDLLLWEIAQAIKHGELTGELSGQTYTAVWVLMGVPD